METTTGIIGYGVLGKAYAKALNIKMYIDIVHNNVELDEMCQKAKWILICVPTPPTKEGLCDTSIVEDWVEKISLEGKDNVIVIRSTVIPGTADSLMEKYNVKIVSAPEFLTESTAEEDAMNPDLVIIGAKEKELAEEFNNFQKSKRETYDPHIVLTNNKTAEFIKYAINSFYATKVIFANQIYQAAKEYGIDYEVVKSAMYRRKWIGNNHLDVYHKGKQGYAGKCLPKDTSAFVEYTKSPLLKLVQELNKELLAKNDDDSYHRIMHGEDPKDIFDT